MEFEYGFVWDYEYLYENYVCVWKSSFGLESLDTWFGTLSFVYGLGLETPKLISF